MRKIYAYCIVVLCLLFIISKNGISQDVREITLSGMWSFHVDSLDVGVDQKWFEKSLTDKIILPGSMTTNNKGDNITINTPWTGGIVDSSWYFKPEYAKYRVSGNIKVPFWLQPVKYYKGPAWYQKTVTIPAGWKNKFIELFLERAHWETQLWVDGKRIGMRNSLGSPHIYDISKELTPGTHRLTLRIDNRIKEINVGINAHSITDHTQSNWNGMEGKLALMARPSVYLEDVQLYPDIENKNVLVKFKINHLFKGATSATIFLQARSNQPGGKVLTTVSKKVSLSANGDELEITYPMGNNPALWDEFHPNLYTMKVSLASQGNSTDEKEMVYGMHKFSTKGTQFLINGRPTFLRGTLECAIFPLTGYPPTDVAHWKHIFQVIKSFGLNHMRFHSWTPPEAAFTAADETGVYLQVECSTWANQGSSIGDGKPIDKYVYDESNRVAKAYGNHPSFCMMAYGNEPAGKDYTDYLIKFVEYWQKKDNRRLYTTAAGWPVVPQSDYNSTPEPRIQEWGAGVNSLINGQPPRLDYDWEKIISKWAQPTVSHEIGQWCVYPDFKEISKYTGILKAKNFEIFRDRLTENGLINLADSFLLASGKLQSLCYKADIEAALRTKNMGGFQLLDLHDFPGQGTALVGVLNPFWEEKGYIKATQYSEFCNYVVPLARFPKMIYLNNETLTVPIEIANFSSGIISNATPEWQISDTKGNVLFQGQLEKKDIPIGNGVQLGVVRQSLNSLNEPGEFVLSVGVGSFKNTWDFFVYPASLPDVGGILVTQQLDGKAIETLNRGGKVLLTLKKGTIPQKMGGDIKIGFSSIFWNTAWTGGQAPNTLGVLVNPKNPVFNSFPTEFYSNWQWWDAMSHSNAILLDSVSFGLKPIVRVIDDWFKGRSLGLIFECKVGNGNLVVSGIDLRSESDTRPEARQMLYSLKKYMTSNAFSPVQNVSIEKIKALIN